MSDHLVNLIDSEVNWAHSDDSDVVTIYLDPRTVRKTTAGTGVFYFYDEGWSNELSFQLETPVSISHGPMQLSIIFDLLARFPCTGIVTSSIEGYLTAPTVKIEVAEGKNIALMLISPRTFPYRITVNKPTLSIPNEASVTVSSNEDQLQIKGTVSGSKFEAVRLIMNRNPHLPVYRSGYNEELCKLTQPGEINTTWKPVARVFEESLLVFYPSTIGGDDVESLAQSLGAPTDDFKVPATVIGDGIFTDYKLQLMVEHRFRTLSDETGLRVI